MQLLEEQVLRVLCEATPQMIVYILSIRSSSQEGARIAEHNSYDQKICNMLVISLPPFLSVSPDLAFDLIL